MRCFVFCNIYKITGWLEDWNVSVEDKQTVFRLLYETHCSCGKATDAASVMVVLLEGFTEDNAGQAREDAIRFDIQMN